MQVYCKFLKNDGYCSKGRYCEFSHDKNVSKVPCKVFHSTGKCFHGKNCSFSHASSSIIPPSLRLSSNLVKDKPPCSSVDSSEESGARRNAGTGNVGREPFSVAAAWGSSNEDTDGVYFYGAPGSFPTGKETTSISQSSYAGIAKKQTEPFNYEIEAESSKSATSTKQICKFYLSGSCRYGQFCRNSHDIEEEMPPIDADIIDDECGICISKPEDGMYGMLNNCDCVFCLKCIRDWRKDGVEIVKDNQRVRMCPLCRVESFFICPSARALRGESKQRALNAYKLSLKQIQCKVS